MIVPDVGNPFFTSMVRGVEDAAQGSGYSVVLCNSDEDLGKEAGYIAAAAAERMAGVIISPASTRDTDVTPLLDLGIPVVAWTGGCPTRRPTPCWWTTREPPRRRPST